MLHLSTVEPATLELLRKLQSLPILNNTRLVGGTALALQFGHRKSVDLDFWSHRCGFFRFARSFANHWNIDDIERF